MRTPRPTTRSAYTFTHLVHTDNNTPFSGFGFFRRNHPTDPLIPRKRCDIRPQMLRMKIGIDCFFKIRREFVHEKFFQKIFFLSLHKSLHRSQECFSSDSIFLRVTASRKSRPRSVKEKDMFVFINGCRPPPAVIVLIAGA